MNATLSTPGCATSAAPAVSPKSVDDVDDARRQPHFVKPVRKFQRGQRRLLGWLQNAGATRRDRGRQLPRRHQQRIIPRNDLRGHAHRLAQRETQRVRRHRIDVALNLRRQPAVVLKAGRHVGDIVFRFDDRLAGVAAFQVRKLRGVLPDLLGKLEQDAAAILRGGVTPRPGIESLARRIYGRVHIALVRRKRRER